MINKILFKDYETKGKQINLSDRFVSLESA